MDGRQARLAFIGCGRHATENLYPCLAQVDEIDLVAVCDAKEELARHNARAYGARRWYTDVDRLLGDEPDLDGAIVVGPPAMMHELGERVLRRRRVPVFVEKPPALSAAAAESFAAVAAECGAWGQVGFMKRFSTGYGLAKQASEQPWFGPVSVLEAKFANGAWGPLWGVYDPPQGFLAVQAIHIFDLVRFLAGPITEVHARYVERAPNSHGFVMTLACTGGAIACLNLNSLESWPAIDERLSLTGAGCFVTVDKMLYVNLYRDEAWGKVEEPYLANFSQGWQPTGPMVPDMRQLMGYRAELREFARCILEGRRPGPDLEAGAAALRAGEAAWESVRTGASVRL